jgi:hypothetical protein
VSYSGLKGDKKGGQGLQPDLIPSDPGPIILYRHDYQDLHSAIIMSGYLKKQYGLGPEGIIGVEKIH